MTPSRSKHVVLTVAASGLLLAGLFVILSGASDVASADPGELFVSPTGSGASCSQSDPCALQTALSQSFSGDTVFVSGGTYTGTGGAVITLTKSIALRGGWDGLPTGPVERDPREYPTVLDGENRRRVVYISGYITPVLDGLVVTGGNATHALTPGYGGGIHSSLAAPIITNNVITSNVAYTGSTIGNGGGIYLNGALESPLISGNVIVSNTANTTGQGRGGGLTIYGSVARISVNTFQRNVAGFTTNSQGGGLYLGSSPAFVSGNLIQENKATPDDQGFGGGLHSQFGDVTFSDNMVVGNASGHGAVTFDSNARITMTNHVVAQNLGGVYVRGSAAFPFVGELAHNTIAQNVTNGVYIGWWYGAESTSLTMTNNIIVSHTTGVYVYDDPTNQVTATHTLLFGNATDSGGGTVLSTNEITGSAPRFVDPPGRDYHILVGSPAIDAGTPVPWLQTDIDGNPRPIGARYDIGADEFPWRVTHLPLVVRNAQP